jgi:hypothetical protein
MARRRLIGAGRGGAGLSLALGDAVAPGSVTDALEASLDMAAGGGRRRRSSQGARQTCMVFGRHLYPVDRAD